MDYAEQMQKLSIRDGDVVVLTGGGFDGEMAQSVIATAKAMGVNRCAVMILSEGETVESLSEERMMQAGWVRADPLLAG